MLSRYMNKAELMDQQLLTRYIAGCATDAEKKEVVEWIAADPEHRREYLSLHRLHDMMLWQEAPSMLEESKPSFFSSFQIWRVGLKIAAVLIVVLLSTVTWRYFRNAQVEETVQQVFGPAGQRVELLLSDGTKVWLNSGSRLFFPSHFKDKERKVRLDGEGYFEVVHQSGKPFVVETGKYDIRVLGTEFNVLAYAKEHEWQTDLMNGSVDISSPGSSQTIVRLAPGTYARRENSGLVQGAIDDYSHFAWRKGILSFEDMPVSEIIRKLELYFDVTIEVHNRSLLNRRYTGKFRIGDGIEHVLRVLQLNNHFDYERDDSKNLITIY